MPDPTYPHVMVTGHRPQRLSTTQAKWAYAELRRVIIRLRDQYGMTTGISGMALGVDQAYADAVLDLGLDLWAYLPCPQQADQWRTAQKMRWERLLAKAARVETISPTYEGPQTMHARNDAMVRDCAAAVVVWDRKPGGGTAAAAQALATAGRPVVLLDPTARTVSSRGDW